MPGSCEVDGWMGGSVVRENSSRSNVWLFGVVCAEGYDACQGGFVLRGSVCFQVKDISSTWVVIVPDVCHE